MTSQRCSCSCGNVVFNVVDQPLFRILCHCTICQRFNCAEFSDIVVYDSASVEGPESGTVNFDTYKPPPNVQRGKCSQCDRPAIEIFEAPLLPGLTMVPVNMFEPEAELPPPIAHIFYDKRVLGAKDEYPKHQGFLMSQLAFLKYLLAARRAEKRRA